jgi:PAS domain S-box-containing protein
MNDQGQKYILLVEDEGLIGMAESMDLKNYGYDVIHVLNGQAAIDILNNQKNKIDIILMDIDLGKGIDGTEIAKIILNNHDIPLLFLSSHIERNIVEKTENITSYGYVVKNSSITVLDASIKMAFRLHEANQNLKKQKLQIENQKRNLLVYEKRYRRLFESAKDGILILSAVNGMIVDVNPFLVEMLGYSKEQFLNKSIWDISAFKNIDYSKQLFKELQDKEYIRYHDLPLETFNGDQIHVEFVSNVYYVDSEKVIQCNIRDITDRIKYEVKLEQEIFESKRIAEEMLQYEIKCRDIVDTTTSIILEWDTKGIVLFLNKYGLNFFGFAELEIVGQNVMDTIVAPIDVTTGQDLQKKIERIKQKPDEYCSTENENVRKNGEKVVIAWNNKGIYNAAGKLIKIISIGIDRTIY